MTSSRPPQPQPNLPRAVALGIELIGELFPNLFEVQAFDFDDEKEPADHFPEPVVIPDINTQSAFPPVKPVQGGNRLPPIPQDLLMLTLGLETAEMRDKFRGMLPAEVRRGLSLVFASELSELDAAFLAAILFRRLMPAVREDIWEHVCRAAEDVWSESTRAEYGTTELSADPE